MKKILIGILLVVALQEEAAGQQLYLYYGRLISTFDYEDSEGNSLNNLSRTTYNSLAMGYRAPITKHKLFMTAGLSYNRYGAKASDPVVDNYYTWDVSFVGVNLGVDYEIFKQQSFFMDQDGFTFYLKGGISTEFLVHGTQTINNQLYNLNGEEQFDKPLFFLRGGVGANYCVSRKLSVFIEYQGGKSFLLFGNSSGDKEKLQYVTHSFGFGLLLSLPDCDYCHSTL